MYIITHLRSLRVEGTASVRNNRQKYLVGVPLVQMLAYLQTILWAAAWTTVPYSPEHHCPLQLDFIWWQCDKSRRMEHIPLHGLLLVLNFASQTDGDCLQHNNVIVILPECLFLIFVCSFWSIWLKHLALILLHDLKSRSMGSSTSKNTVFIIFCWMLMMNWFGWVKWGASVACLPVFLLLKNSDTMCHCLP
jgi:hypothetical protein